MRINFICVGSKMPAWVNSGYEEYAKRLNKDVTVKLVEIAASKRSKASSAEKYKTEEAARIKKVLSKGAYVVVLDVNGKQLSTEKLSTQLGRWQHLGKDINLIVGGPDGLGDDIIQMANESWSLSQLTFPHPIVRVVVAEQIYRAWSMNNNHPYHRE